MPSRRVRQVRDMWKLVVVTSPTTTALPSCTERRFSSEKSTLVSQVPLLLATIFQMAWYTSTSEFCRYQAVRRLKAYPVLLFDHFLNVASNESLSISDTKHVVVFGIYASHFENYEFTEVTSNLAVGMLVFTTVVPALQCQLATLSQLLN